MYTLSLPQKVLSIFKLYLPPLYEELCIYKDVGKCSSFKNKILRSFLWYQFMVKKKKHFKSSTQGWTLIGNLLSIQPSLSCCPSSPPPPPSCCPSSPPLAELYSITLKCNLFRYFQNTLLILSITCNTITLICLNVINYSQVLWKM